MEQQKEGQGPPGPPRMSGLAIASLVLAILAVPTCITALPGLVLGIIALVQIGRRPQALRGYGMALAGTIISGIAVLFVPITAAILFPVFARAREAAKQAGCMSNVHQIGLAMQMYRLDNQRYPAPGSWNDALRPYVKNPSALVCPSVGGREPTYAMNARGTGYMNPPADIVLLFESVPGENRSGGPELFPSPPRHMDKHTVGFVDGHAEAVEASQASELMWDLEQLDTAY